MVSLKTKILITILLLISAIAVFVAFRPQKQDRANNPYVPPVALAQPSKATEITSPDGKMILTMKEEKGKENVTYIFTLKDEAKNTQNQVYTNIVPMNVSMSIPLNTFSPDNKYFFLKESNGQDNYLAFSVSGTQIANFSDLFYAKHPEYKITEATGWGGINLIVFNTENIEGEVGPSFWFDIPSKSFIQLSNRFD